MGYRILIVDENAMAREAVCDFFKRRGDCESSFAAADTSSAMRHLRKSRVDIVLLDYDLGAEIAQAFFDQLREFSLKITVLAVSTGISHAGALRAIAMGAAGILWKASTLTDLVDCVGEVLRGGTCEDSECLHRSLRDMPAVPFSEAQAQVLRGIAAGFPNMEIARRLGVSEPSVNCTVKQIFDKTGVRSRSALARCMA
jgi:two-component system nitrate/nitrite response regulator NarL